MDTEPNNNKSPAGCLSGTAGIIAASAALVTAITGLVIALHSPGSDGETTTFSAVSHCSARNVNGYGKSKNEGMAQSIAIGECIRKGGVPNCCAEDVRVSQD
jgi:hypothetical protein